MARRFDPRNLALAAGATLFTLGVLGATGELAVRYRERHRETSPGTAPFLYYKSVRLRHAMVRNSDYFGWANINAAGFRGTREVSLAPAPDRVRIFAVGASTTFDGPKGDDSAWPAKLEGYLNAAAGETSFEVVNAGVGGYVMLDNNIRLQSEFFRYRPDVMILYHGHNELFATLNAARSTPVATDRPGEMPADSRIGRWLGRNSLLYAKVAERIRLRWNGFRAAGARAAEPADWDAVLAAGADDFERELESFVLLARQFGIVVVMPEVVQMSGADVARRDPRFDAVWRASVGAAPPEVVLKGYEAFNERIVRVAARFALPSIPTAGFGMEGDSLYLPDDPIHFNIAGSDRFARLLAPALLDLGLPDRVGPQPIARMRIAPPLR